jgi:hypothetical protein
VFRNGVEGRVLITIRYLFEMGSANAFKDRGLLAPCSICTEPANTRFPSLVRDHDLHITVLDSGIPDGPSCYSLEANRQNRRSEDHIAIPASAGRTFQMVHPFRRRHSRSLFRPR